jgi:membrane-associated phospholipid phosphatase
MPWSYLSALGGLNVTALIALMIAAWLVGARCWRLALAWCLLFVAGLSVAVATQVAFLGWGIGVRAVDFTGFSGHATRAASVYPVAVFLLLERRPPWLRGAGVALGALFASAVALARVKVGAHSVSEATLGFALGLTVSLLFFMRAYGNRRGQPKPLLIALALSMLVLPGGAGDPGRPHQWVTALALSLSQHDRPYERASWQRAATRYVPPCAPERVHFGYICT